MPFYAQANMEGKTTILTRMEEDSQATRIELAFKDFIKVLEDFISDSDQLSDEEFGQLLDAAGSIQSINILRNEDPCRGCSGDCVKCGKIL